MRTLAAFIASYPGRCGIMLVALVVAGLAEGLSISTLLPMLSVAVGGETESGLGKLITDRLTGLGIDPTIEVMLLIVVGGMVFKSVLLLLANRQVGYTVAHVATSLRLELIDALLASRWDYYLRQHTGALANSIATEAYRAATGFQFGAIVIALAIQALVYTAIALAMAWHATLVSLLAGGMFVYILHRLVRAARRAGSGQTRLLRSLLSYLTDVLGSVKPLKAMARDNAADTILREQTTKLEQAMRREVMAKESLRALQEPILTALAAVGLYIALVHLGMSLPTVTVLVFVLVRILSVVNKAQRQFQHMSAQESAYWALRAAAQQARNAAEIVTGSLPPSIERGISLRAVTFSYESKPVFRDLDMDIPAGTFTAVAGPSGIGKSTFLDLLCGLAVPASGAILVDGVPLSELDLRAWRRLIGYVPQETILLHDSVLNNVTVGEPGLTEEDAERALGQAGAGEFVAALPQGWHTAIGERGGMLSGGQRQRIAIARALAHRPRLLILDEPTSALDRESERVICDTLKSLAGKLTIIVVSHQPHLLAAADQVFRIEDGKAVAVLSTAASSTAL